MALAVSRRRGSGSLQLIRSFTSTCPLLTHHRWVTKRLIKGFFLNPEGWPENCPVWSSTLLSYRVLWLCHRQLTPRYRQLVADASSSKRVHHLKSAAEMKAFLQAVKQEHQSI